MKALQSFLGGYLHQDWDVEASDPQELVAEFAREKLELVAEAIGEIEILLSMTQSEDEVARRAYEMGCYFDPQPVSMRNWLAGAARTMVREVATRLKSGESGIGGR